MPCCAPPKAPLPLILFIWFLILSPFIFIGLIIKSIFKK